MKTIDLECTRQINATPDEVYAVWLDPTCPGSPWFGPNGNGMTSKVLMSAAVDTAFYHCVTRGGSDWAHYGRFIKLDSGTLVEHTWVGEWTKGRETVVTTTFEAKDGGTLVRLRHTGVPDDEQGKQHLGGWQWCLGQLADRMASKRA